MSRLQELKGVLPSLSDDQVQKLLSEMKKKKMIHVTGKTRGRYGIQAQARSDDL